MRVFLAFAVIALFLVGVVAIASATDSQDACMQSPDYGHQCVVVSGHGLTVTGLEAKFTDAPDFLDQVAWTFETTTYRCDPRGRTKSECPPEQTVYGPVHRKNPHGTAGTVCAGEGVRTLGGCSGNLNFAVPRTFAGSRWLCVEIAVRVNGKWVDNGAGIPQGDRACRLVH